LLVNSEDVSVPPRSSDIMSAASASTDATRRSVPRPNIHVGRPSFASEPETLGVPTPPTIVNGRYWATAVVTGQTNASMASRRMIERERVEDMGWPIDVECVAAYPMVSFRCDLCDASTDVVESAELRQSMETVVRTRERSSITSHSVSRRTEFGSWDGK
jgi:hypothetical protein